MQLIWTGANVVLLAQSHNPSIVSPEWLQKYQIVDENPEDFVHTPVFSLFRSQTFQLLVEQQRSQFSLRILNEASLHHLQAATANYAQLLPHVPYTAVGLNYAWRGLAERPGEGFELVERLFLSEAGRAWRDHLKGQVRAGMILYQVSESYRLRLLVEPLLTPEGHLSLDFNYHFDVRSFQEAIKAVNRLQDFFKDAQQIANRLLGLE
ncbi:MAG: hypothetical protein HY347_04040 [candidate division NC10 bacterium]|nr:hypothetical protein [candidate division NC10 bacterium]